ncbi:MAG: type 1 glutamine amidotransferase domain-containing protein [Cyclobacteriaceae bacterium]
MKKKKIVIVAANPAISTTTGWPVGFWASEVTHPYKKFIQAGYEVTLASPQGGKLSMDTLSDPFDESGYSAWDEISKEVIPSTWFQQAIADSPSLDSIDLDKYDVLLIAGGQAPMFNFEGDAGLIKNFADFYQSGKITAALCHGTAILNYAKDQSGKLIARGKNVTGFTNDEEEDADKAAGVKVMPWRIEDALKMAGANFMQASNWQSYVVIDGNLITGQQNMSGEAVADAIIEKLENR